MMVWVGVRVEAVGKSLVQAGIDFQRRKDARRDRIRRRMEELRPQVEPAKEEARA